MIGGQIDLIDRAVDSEADRLIGKTHPIEVIHKSRLDALSHGHSLSRRSSWNALNTLT